MGHASETLAVLRAHSGVAPRADDVDDGAQMPIGHRDSSIGQTDRLCTLETKAHRP